MDHGYPAARPEARGDGTPRIAKRYEAIESSAEITCADTDTAVHIFSGRPDAIDLAAHTFSAVFTFQDEMGRELGEMLVPAGAVYLSHISCNRVLARNAVAGSVAVVQVLGKWTTARIETDPDPEQKAALGP